MTNTEKVKNFEQLYNCSVEEVLESPSWGPSASDNHSRGQSLASLYFKVMGVWRDHYNEVADPVIGGRYSYSGDSTYVRLSNPCLAISGPEDDKKSWKINPFTDPNISIWGDFSLSGEVEEKNILVSFSSIKVRKRDKMGEVIYIIFSLSGRDYIYITRDIKNPEVSYEMKYVHRIDLSLLGEEVLSIFVNIAAIRFTLK